MPGSLVGLGSTNERHLARGPIYMAGNLYMAVMSNSGAEIRMFKSTDDGDTWTEQDATNAPVANATRGGMAMGKSQANGQLLVAWIDNYTAPVGKTPCSWTHNIARFDTDTDLWGAEDAYSVVSTDLAMTAPDDLQVQCGNNGITDYMIGAAAASAVMGNDYKRTGQLDFDGTTLSPTGAYTPSVTVDHTISNGTFPTNRGGISLIQQNTSGDTLMVEYFYSGSAGQIGFNTGENQRRFVSEAKSDGTNEISVAVPANATDNLVYFETNSTATTDTDRALPTMPSGTFTDMIALRGPLSTSDIYLISLYDNGTTNDLAYEYSDDEGVTWSGSWTDLETGISGTTLNNLSGTFFNDGVDDWFAISVNIDGQVYATGYNLTGGSGSTLTASLFSPTVTFPTATLSHEITPSLLSITPSFGAATIKETQPITGVLLSVTPSFPTAQLDQSFTGALLSITPTFPTATLSHEILGVLLSVTPTFGTATIKEVQTITGVTHTVTATFPQATVIWEQFLEATPLSVSPTFPTAQLDQGFTGSTLSVTPSFGAATIKEVQTIAGPTLSVTPSFPQAQLDQGFTAPLLSVSPTFGLADIRELQELVSNLVSVTASFPQAQVDQGFTGSLLSVTATFGLAQLNQTFTGSLLSITPTFPQAGIATSGGPQTVTATLFSPTVSFPTATIFSDQFLTASLLSVSTTFLTATVSSLYTITGQLFSPSVTFGAATVSSNYNIDGALVSVTPSFGTGGVTSTGATQDIQPGTPFSVAPTFPTATLSHDIAGTLVSVSAAFPTARLRISVTGVPVSVTPTFGTAGFDRTIPTGPLSAVVSFGAATIDYERLIQPSSPVIVTATFPKGAVGGTGAGITPEATEAQGIAQEMCLARALPGDLDYVGSLNALNGGTDLEKLGVLVALGATPGADILLALEQLAFDGLGKADFNELMRRWAESGNY